MELNKLSAHRLLDLLNKKEITVQEITQSIFAQIDRVEDKVKAYVTLTEDLANSSAEKMDKNIKRGDFSLNGLIPIPIALKDNLCTKGINTTCSSRILYNFKPPYNATVVEKLLRVGTPFIGKTNMDEFAMGSSTENSGFFPTHNPWDLSRVPGGSSGGSAAAVAADETIWALGSDTGGSIRQPAAFCGVVGMKPTYGRVSRFGLIAFASSLDQIGPITKDVKDCALLLNLISGKDKFDSTSANIEVPDFTQSLLPEIKGIKIGVPVEFLKEGIAENVKTVVKEAIKKLESLGAIIEEVNLPHIDYALSTYYIIAPSEASSNLARYDGVQYGLRIESNGLIEMYKKTRCEGFGAEVKRRIMLGTYALSAGYYDAYYLKALKVRTLICEDFKCAFKKYDVLVSPTTPTTAFKIGEKVSDPLQMYMSDIYTIPVNLAGLPAISIPCGEADGLPVGLQIIGKPFDEETILRVAYTYEQSTPGNIGACKI